MKNKIIMKSKYSKITIVVFLLTLLSCTKDGFEETVSLDPLGQEVALKASANCNNNAIIRQFSPRLEAIQGDRCNVERIITGNPGLLDCRALNRGSHKQNGPWFIYNIVQGNKHVDNPTAVRIERAFRAFDRPTDTISTKATFSGTVRVERLPNDPDIVRHISDYTYICQMHGSGQIFNFDGPLNSNNHSSAIWLLRAQRNSNTTFEFVLEYSTRPNTSPGGSQREQITFGGSRDFDTPYEIEVNFGYDANGNYDGIISIDGTEFEIPDYNFTTGRQFFRYGAYRAGRNIAAVNRPRFFNQAIIAWKNDVTFCNP